MTYSWQDACRPGKVHRFHRKSGWCANGCGHRDDGRIVNFAGTEVRPGPVYTPDELDQMRTAR